LSAGGHSLARCGQSHAQGRAPLQYPPMWRSRVWLRMIVVVASACSDQGSPNPQGDQDAASAPQDDAHVDEEAHPDGGTSATASPPDANADDAPSEAAVGSDASEAQTATPVGASLVLPDLWRTVEPVEDPFEDRPETTTCPSWAAAAETLGGERAFGVDTGSCNYITVMQESREAVAAGESIKIRLWHFELSAPTEAEAHAALLIDGLAVLDERVAIPQAGGLISRQVRLTRAVAAGARVYFHLHNHGSNSWALVEVSRAP
jgi:hypothetical protein